MKHPYESYIQPFMTKTLKNARAKWRLTQANMSELLRISERSYSDLERGRSCASTGTFVCYLVMLEEVEIVQLVRELRAILEQAEQEGGDVA